MLPLLLPLLTSIVPSLIGHLFGSNAEDVAQKVTGVTQEIFGSVDPAEIQRQMAADAQKAVEYKMKLLDVQSSEQERQHQERLAEIADLTNARSTFGNNPAVFKLGVVILLTFAAVISASGYGAFEVMTDGIKIRDPGTVAAVFGFVGTLVGYVAANAQQVVSYFFGSSRGSDEKTRALSDQAMKTADTLAKQVKNGH